MAPLGLGWEVQCNRWRRRFLQLSPSLPTLLGSPEAYPRRRAVLATMGTPDQREGIRAFLEMRRPRFHRDG
jgi:hypothetical protein